MNDLGIYVFSGTGNTFKCAEALKDALADFGVSADLHDIGEGSVKPKAHDMILCYPVHGFNAPNAMLGFCRELPEGSGNIWFLKTSGEPLKLNDNSSSELIKILRRKGYSIKGEFHYIMPYNMIFRHSDEMATLMWKTANERIKDAAQQITKGEGIVPDPGLPAKLASGLCRIEHWFYPKNGRLFRVDANKCIRCMKCISDCPSDNIQYEDNEFRFGNNCCGCFRCSFNCPEDAMHIGLLDPMRVNGPYNFGRDPGKAKIGRYCRKAYRRYFTEHKEPIHEQEDQTHNRDTLDI